MRRFSKASHIRCISGVYRGVQQRKIASTVLFKMKRMVSKVANVSFILTVINCKVRSKEDDSTLFGSGLRRPQNRPLRLPPLLLVTTPSNIETRDLCISFIWKIPHVLRVMIAYNCCYERFAFLCQNSPGLPFCTRLQLQNTSTKCCSNVRRSHVTSDTCSLPLHHSSKGSRIRCTSCA